MRVRSGTVTRGDSFRSSRACGAGAGRKRGIGTSREPEPKPGEHRGELGGPEQHIRC